MILIVYGGLLIRNSVLVELSVRVICMIMRVIIGMRLRVCLMCIVIRLRNVSSGLLVSLRV